MTRVPAQFFDNPNPPENKKNLKLGKNVLTRYKKQQIYTNKIEYLFIPCM